MHLRALLLTLGLLFAAPALPLTPVPCPAGFNCSYTYTLTFAPAIPATIVINWYTTPGGAIDHTRTIRTSTGSASFEVPGGKWYVQLTVSAQDGSLAPTMVTYVIQYPTLLVPLGPAPPLNFTVT